MGVYNEEAISNWDDCEKAKYKTNWQWESLEFPLRSNYAIPIISSESLYVALVESNWIDPFIWVSTASEDGFTDP